MFGRLGREGAWFTGSVGVAGLFAAALAALAVPGAGADAGAYADALIARLWGVLSLDFGASTISGADSLAEIAPTLGASLSLLGPAFVLAFMFGAPLGLVLADRKTRPFAGPFFQLAAATPVFCAALLIAAAAAVLAPGVSPGEGPSFYAALASGKADDILRAGVAAMALVLPIALAGAGVVASAIAAAITQALDEPYREKLHQLGLGQREILRVYVSRRALALALSALGDVVLALIAATAVVERLFDWPGAGAQFLHAAALENWPVVAALVFAIALARVIADLVGRLLTLALTGPTAGSGP